MPQEPTPTPTAPPPAEPGVEATPAESTPEAEAPTESQVFPLSFFDVDDADQPIEEEPPIEGTEEKVDGKPEPPAPAAPPTPEPSPPEATPPVEAPSARPPAEPSVAPPAPVEPEAPKPEAVPGPEGKAPAQGQEPVKAPETPEAKEAREAKEAKEAEEAKKKEASVAPPPEPEKSFVEQIQGNREALEQKVAQDLYPIDEKTMEALDENPAEAIPKLLAKVYLDGLVASYGLIARNVPQFVETAVTRRQDDKAAEDNLFGMFPGLTREHLPLVTSLTSTFRAMSPQASDEDILAQAGSAALASLKLNGAAPPAVPGAPPVVPAQGQVVSERVVGKPTVKGFQPAGVGEAAPGGTPPLEENQFAQILGHMQAPDVE